MQSRRVLDLVNTDPVPIDFGIGLTFKSSRYNNRKEVANF